MLVIAYAIPPILVCKGLASPWVLLTYLSFPQALKLWGILRGELSGQALNPVLGKTAALLLFYCLLFAAGLLLN